MAHGHLHHATNFADEAATAYIEIIPLD
jgi:hypothetical protein